jgi:UDP-2-acetamido-3-amino-2,3-dideoxy-glucuronate N-acetyltransferase
LINSKKLGLMIMVLGPILATIYAVDLIFYLSLVVQITALTFMVLFFGIVTWIGYTMLTEPASSRPIRSDADLENLEPEIINPPLESDESLRVTRTTFSKVTDCSIGERTEIRDQVNLFKCKIGSDCKIESFVYIEEGVTVGDRCKIKPNVFIPTGVTIEDDVFIGPNATFTNDKHPNAAGDWVLLETTVGRGASIGAHAVILPGVKIGEKAVIGAGAVVTKDVPANATAIGNPAHILANTQIREKLVR